MTITAARTPDIAARRSGESGSSTAPTSRSRRPRGPARLPDVQAPGSRAGAPDGTGPGGQTRAEFLAEIRTRLDDVYTSEGIDIWLRSKSRNLYGFTPNELLQAGDPTEHGNSPRAWVLLRDELDRVTGGMG